jgi:hypothetical protein
VVVARADVVAVRAVVVAGAVTTVAAVATVSGVAITVVAVDSGPVVVEIASATVEVVGVAATAAGVASPTLTRNAAAVAATRYALRRAFRGKGAPFYQDTARCARWRWIAPPDGRREDPSALGRRFGSGRWPRHRARGGRQDGPAVRRQFFG